MCLFIYRAIQCWFIWLWGCLSWKRGENRKKTNNVGNVLSRLCILKKKEVPICQLMVPWGALSTQALSGSWSLCPAQRQALSRSCRASLSRLFPCLTWCGGASFSHWEPQFPCRLKGNRHYRSFHVVFRINWNIMQGKGLVQCLAHRELLGSEEHRLQSQPGFESCLCQLLAVWP